VSLALEKDIIDVVTILLTMVGFLVTALVMTGDS